MTDGTPASPATDSARGPILVALDGSPAAQGAALAAIQIARALELKIEGLYVVDETRILDPYANHRTDLGRNEQAPSRPELIEQFKRQGEEALAWLEERCRAANVGASVEIALCSVADLVLRRAGGASVLALGRCGRQHKPDAGRLGGKFRWIAHRAPCPFLAGGTVRGELRRLLLAYNGSPRARDALVWAARLQQALATEVVVLTVQESPNAPAADNASRAARDQVPAEHLAHYRFLTRDGKPDTHIVSVAAESEVDCIVLGGYRHTAVVEWLVGSTVDGVLKQTQLPVLVV